MDSHGTGPSFACSKSIMSKICAIVKIKFQPFDFFPPVPSATPAPLRAFYRRFYQSLFPL